MLLYNIAIVEDKGKFWEVRYVSKNDQEKILDEGLPYLRLSDISFTLIDKAIMHNKIVRINKPIKYNEVQPEDIVIVKRDKDDLDYLKTAAIIRAKTLVNPEISKESGYTMYEFMMMNNELASEGFFITNKNREEKYIEIIETADEKLINLLETYLEIKDKIDRVFHLKDRIDKFTQKINKLQTKEEIETLEDDFISELYSYIK